jgi:hypothetical protein
VELDPSQERLAETVLKLEREVYQTQRPRQLANRGVFLRIGEPIDLRCFVSAYLKDARSVRHRVAQELRDRIQGLIDAMAAVTAASSGVRSDGSAVGSFGRRETCPVDEPPGDQPKPPEANHSGRSEASVRD